MNFFSDEDEVFEEIKEANNDLIEYINFFYADCLNTRYFISEYIFFL